MGGGGALAEDARRANTAGQVLDMAAQAGLPLGDRIAAMARETALGVLAGGVAVEVVIFDRESRLVGRADG